MSEPPPSKTVHNERTKLTAGLLNGVATASVAAGVITPLAALTFGFGTAPGRDPILVTLLSLAWLVAGGVLHLIARHLLGRLKE